MITQEMRCKEKICKTYGLSLKNFKILKRLNTPKKIQDFLDTLPINFEHGHETYMSVERALNAGKAHCLEAGLIVALALWIQGEPPLLLDLKSNNGDDHIVALYKIGKSKRVERWGAISKTNHTTLRFRDPVYESVRELALSYFHEYIHLKTGEKILESYSEPFDLSKVKLRQIKDWVSGAEELFWLAEDIDKSPHHQIYPASHKKYLRKADHMELKAGNVIEWKGTDKGV
jgi:hypothetical protein